MKGKIKKTLATIFIAAAGLIVCRLLYLLLDSVMNGMVLEWLDREFVSYTWTEEGQYYFASIRWWRVKDVLFEFFVVFTLFTILFVRLAVLIGVSRREKKVVEEAGRKIREYMKHDREAADVFPPEYAAISAQVAEIKADMQRHEQTLKEEAARKNDLITYLAHDLKTPLTSVVGYLSLLNEAPDMPPEQRAKYVHITLDKALRLEKLINEFFEITRYNLQQIVLEKETVDLAFLLVQMTDEFYPILSEHGNRIRLELPEEKENLMVYADAEKLARVFNNILKNAVAYSYPDTEILIKGEAAGGRLRLTFSNRGKTIPRQKLDSVFEKFFRLDDARSTNSGGAGLGLAIAKEIVNLHGGTIAAESENEVTSFIVELPSILPSAENRFPA